MWLSTHQIDSQQLQALIQLVADCKIRDGYSIPYYPHIIRQYRSLPSNVLYYHHKRLVGFLSVFFFYSDACEIAIMVSPPFRNRGIAKRMLHGILPLLQTQRITNLIFSTPSHSNQAWLKNKGLTYQNSEFEMRLVPKQPFLLQSHDLIVRQAHDTDIDALCLIDTRCFSLPRMDNVSRFKELLHSPVHTLLLILKETQIMGKAHLFFHENQCRLSDIAVLPAFQKRGYGSYLIKFCINFAIEKQQLPIFLDVETENKNALLLYTNLGFEVLNARDFWMIPLHSLT